MTLEHASPIAVALKHMMAAGMPADAICAAVAEMEALNTPVRFVNAERTARYRARRGLPESQWVKLRSIVFDRDDNTCVYCGSIDDLTCDHIVPLMAGGGNELDNLATACRPCNSSKRDRSLAEWRGVQ